MRTGLMLGMLSMLTVGCYGPQAEAAIVTSIVGYEENGQPFGLGNICLAVVPDGHSVGANFSGDLWALRGLSEWEAFEQALYIRPPEMPAIDVDEVTGELAMEWTWTVDSFGPDEWQVDEIETHHGEEMYVGHWGADPDCEDITRPDDLEYPGD